MGGEGEPAGLRYTPYGSGSISRAPTAAASSPSGEQRQPLLGDDLRSPPRSAAPARAGRLRSAMDAKATLRAPAIGSEARAPSTTTSRAARFVGAPRLTELADDALVGRTELDPPPLQLGLDARRCTAPRTGAPPRRRGTDRRRSSVSSCGLSSRTTGMALASSDGPDTAGDLGTASNAEHDHAGDAEDGGRRRQRPGDREQERERDEERERPQPAELVRRDAEHPHRRRRRRDEAAQQRSGAHDACGDDGAVAPAPGEERAQRETGGDGEQTGQRGSRPSGCRSPRVASRGSCARRRTGTRRRSSTATTTTAAPRSRRRADRRSRGPCPRPRPRRRRAGRDCPCPRR